MSLSDPEWLNKKDPDLVRLQLLKTEINEEKLSEDEVEHVTYTYTYTCFMIVCREFISVSAC